MDALAFEHHLSAQCGRGEVTDTPHQGSAGGAACGDVVSIRAAFTADGKVSVGYDAEGCGALIACASAAAQIVGSLGLREAAMVGTSRICEELGGLGPAKVHAAELVCDALHRALGSLAMEAELEEVPGLTLVALSGGVDSAVAAHLSAKRGPVAGVTVELWRDSQTDAEQSCCSHVAVRRARSLAHASGMAHFTLDLRDDFRAGVVDPWIEGYGSGSTPNPCVNCNGRVRLAPMAQLARRIGAQRLATGHYARTCETSDPRGPVLRSGVDPTKDQAYALMRVPPEVLSLMDFPLGQLTKAQVRAIAHEEGIPVAHQPDSQDLCFLAGTGRDGFLERHGRLGDNPGAIVDQEGRQIGQHSGHHRHTVGQRKGLGVGGGTPLYVLSTDPTTNTVTVGPRADLKTTKVKLCDVDLRREAFRVTSVHLRHRAKSAPARLVTDGPYEALIELLEPLERVAPGQVACLMDGEIVVGCGTVAPQDA